MTIMTSPNQLSSVEQAAFEQLTDGLAAEIGTEPQINSAAHIPHDIEEPFRYRLVDVIRDRLPGVAKKAGTIATLSLIAYTGARSSQPSAEVTILNGQEPAAVAINNRAAGYEAVDNLLEDGASAGFAIAGLALLTGWAIDSKNDIRIYRIGSSPAPNNHTTG